MAEMKFRYLGDSGMLVSRVCLGTMTFGMKGWGCDQQTSLNIVRKFVENGGNFIDSADMYSAGISEEFLGQALSDLKRDDLVIATKCWFRMGNSPNAKGLSRKHIFEAIENSLRRLKTDYIDLYQLHGPDPHTPIEITMRAMDDLVASGKVRYLGCSNFYAWQIVKANAVAERNRWSKLVSGQHLYNILRRDVEREILPACEDQRMGLLCWSPLASGLLTGKYDTSQSPKSDSRIGLRAEIDMPRYWNESSFKIINEVKAVANECSQTPSQVALAWLLADRRVSSVIVGVRTVEQLESSIAVGDWDLPQQQCDRLAQIVPFQMGYPHEWIQITKANTAGHET
jgi:1-deoxyxylulose-5-phosphate synthase